jgi:hypothetical protein
MDDTISTLIGLALWALGSFTLGTVGMHLWQTHKPPSVPLEAIAPLLTGAEAQPEASDTKPVERDEPSEAMTPVFLPPLPETPLTLSGTKCHIRTFTYRDGQRIAVHSHCQGIAAQYLTDAYAQQLHPSSKLVKVTETMHGMVE